MNLFANDDAGGTPTDAALKAKRKALKKADKQAAKERAQRERQMGARRRR